MIVHGKAMGTRVTMDEGILLESSRKGEPLLPSRQTAVCSQSRLLRLHHRYRSCLTHYMSKYHHYQNTFIVKLEIGSLEFGSFELCEKQNLTTHNCRAS